MGPPDYGVTAMPSGWLPVGSLSICANAPVPPLTRYVMTVPGVYSAAYSELPVASIARNDGVRLGNATSVAAVSPPLTSTAYERMNPPSALSAPTYRKSPADRIAMSLALDAPS